jgi:hypothetical protein
VEWLKVKALSSSPSTVEKQKQRTTNVEEDVWEKKPSYILVGNIN